MSSSNWQSLVMVYSVGMFGWEWVVFFDVLFGLEITMYTICTNINTGHRSNGLRTLHSKVQAVAEPSPEFQEQIIALFCLVKGARKSRIIIFANVVPPVRHVDLVDTVNKGPASIFPSP
jgi:hypothetical protein